jgi:hypothetical protein
MGELDIERMGPEGMSQRPHAEVDATPSLSVHAAAASEAAGWKRWLAHA